MAARRKATGFLDALGASFPSERIEVPELDRTITVRALSARAMRRLLESCLKPGKSMDDEDAFDEELLSDRMLAACLVDETGERLIPVGEEGTLQDVLPNRLYVELTRAATRVNRHDDSGN